MEEGSHKSNFDSVHQLIIDNERHGDDPIKIARLISKVIDQKNLKVRYSVGKFLDTLAGKLKPFLPQKTFEWLIMNHYKI